MKQIRVSDLRVGDIVDLEGDAYADPRSDHIELQCELHTVCEIDYETPECTVVYFENYCGVGFPPSHTLNQDDERTHDDRYDEAPR